MQALAALGTLAWWPRAHAAAPARQRGGARLNVRDFGAAGAGKRDETTALQAAINALPATGGTVVVPAGRYLINPLVSLRLRSRLHLQLDPQAWLIAIPNAAPRAYVLTAHDVEQVEITGGQIYGERDRHRSQAGEWGHGIMIRGARAVTVRDMTIQRCWGDGISIGGISGAQARPSHDVLISDVVCKGNRRQGLTIGRSRQVRVLRSEFRDTGGVLPGCGIDVEPDPGDVAQDIRIEDCLASGNRGAGIQLYRRSQQVQVRRCRLIGNQGEGLLVFDAHDCLIQDNEIRENGLRGIAVKAGSARVRIAGNRFGGNARAIAARQGGERGWMNVDIARGTQVQLEQAK